MKAALSQERCLSSPSAARCASKTCLSRDELGSFQVPLPAIRQVFAICICICIRCIYIVRPAFKNSGIFRRIWTEKSAAAEGVMGYICWMLLDNFWVYPGRIGLMPMNRYRSIWCQGIAHRLTLFSWVHAPRVHSRTSLTRT